MNFAILLNSAPNYRPFFCALGNELAKNGHNVIFILDSHLTDFTYANSLTEKAYYFTDYAKGHFSQKIKSKTYETNNLWSIYTSDFERGTYFGLFKNKKERYHQGIIATLINFFEEIFLEEKIDAVIYENVSNTFSYAAYVVAQTNKIAYLGITDSRLPNKHHLMISSLTLTAQINELYHKIVNKEVVPASENCLDAENYLANLVNLQPGYMAYNGLNYDVKIFSRYVSFAKLKLFISYIKYIRYFKDEIYYAFQTGNPFKSSFRAIVNNVKRKFKLKVIQRYFMKEGQNQQPYYLYPLHFHPESSTSIQARHYLDEYNVILNISQNLPFNTCLYVKDHPSAAGFPKLEFYKKIAALPNVFLIDYRVNSKKLALNSEGVITLTSTLGFEALLLGKSVVLLGDEFYEVHPNCFKLNNFNELHTILNSKEFKASSESIKEKSKMLLQAYIMTAGFGALDYQKNYVDPQLLNTIYKEIVGYINEV